MSSQPRYHDTGQGSFFGEYAYRAILERHRGHFLLALKHLFNWEEKSAVLIQLYKGRGLVGRAPYPPAMIFKMLFLSYLYNLSERRMQELADLNLLVKWFLNLAVDVPAPDHSTLTAFKNRLCASRKREEVLQKLFDQMILEAEAQGLVFGELQVLDSVHTRADVNADKDRERQEKGQPSRDPEARVVHKGKRVVVQPDGERTTQEVRYRGYKTHVSVNAATGIVTSLEPALGDTADNKAFPALRAHDRALGLPTRAYGGDRAYDDTEIYTRLEEEGLETAITLKKSRTRKKDPHKERWQQLEADPVYQARRKQRFRVEQPFGTAKRDHGFERCRYLGLARYSIQAFFTFMVVNVKRIVKLLTGITFRPQAKGRRAEKVTPVLTAWSWA